MTKPRSLDDALSESLNPEEQEFFKMGKAPSRPADKNPATPPRRHHEPVPAIVATPSATHPAPTSAPSVQPSSHSVTLNTRIRHSLDDALFTAILDRKARRVVPSAKRQIVEEALSAWLKANGYLS